MQRRAFVMAGALAAAAPDWALGQSARRPRIGYLLFSPMTDPPSRERQAFLDGLREFGHVPGKTVEIFYRSAEGETGFMEAVAEDLVKQRPDVIAVSGTAAVLAAKKATRTIPIVILALGDPVGIGVVPSLARPGGNVTGVSFLSSELTPKRLQLALACVPRVKRLSIIWDRLNANSRAESRAALAAAKKLDLSAESLGLGSDTELARALGRLATERPDLLYVTFEGGLAAANRTVIAEFGLRHRIPIVTGWHAFTEAGALLSYAPDIPSMFRRAAYFVDRVLHGAKPADLPIELPTKVDLMINLRTAKSIGIILPRELLLRADRVVE
jgi:putative ABC transport system substrate-binding protein